MFSRKGWDYPRNLIVEPDGSLLMITAARPDWSGEACGSPHLLLERSADCARTWDRDHTIRLSTSNGFYVGWAVTLQLPDHSLITSYAATTYAEQPPDKVTSEVVRWELPPVDRRSQSPPSLAGVRKP